MVKIRLNRMGSKRNPHYRIVVVDAKKKRSSDCIEQLGFYDPRHTGEVSLKLNAERAAHWLSVGAQPTDTVVRLFETQGVEVPSVRAKRADAYVKRTGASA
ncbi:MAG: 30S ribosomal protein S16 [Trueperaceae bacterium]